MIDEKDYDHYWEKGWVVVEDVFAAAEVEHIAALAVDIGRQEMEREKVNTSSFWTDMSQEGELAPRKVISPFTKHADFRKFVLDDRVTNLVAGLIDEAPLLCSDQIFMKPPRFGSAKPYHQDNFYFGCTPGGGVITAWIALDDAEEINGCLRYIDGSHQNGVIPHHTVPGEDFNETPPPELIDVSKESLAPVGRGGIVFHHSETLHTSYRNESDRWRRGYATHWSSAKVTSTNHFFDHAYFKRADYPT